MLTLESDIHWRKYRDIVARANVVCLEVVVEITRITISEEPVGRVDEIPFSIENMTQESTFVEDVPNPTCDPSFVSDYDMAIASDHFDNNTFEEQNDTDAADDDDISLVRRTMNTIVVMTMMKTPGKKNWRVMLFRPK